MNIIKHIKEKFQQYKAKRRENKILNSCGNVCFCKNCREPLNDDSECKTIEYGVYEYSCIKCGTKSKFNFIIAPCPILIEDWKMKIYDEYDKNNSIYVKIDNI